MFIFKKKRPKPAKDADKAQVTIRADLTQVEELARLGAITPAQADRGRAAGGLLVTVSAQAVAEFQAQTMAAKAGPPHNNELAGLAQRIDEAGLNVPARVLLAGGRPVSFVSSQFLLTLQPLANLGLGAKPAEKLGSYSRLLENRSNLDELMQRLDELDSRKLENQAHNKQSKETRP